MKIPEQIKKGRERIEKWENTVPAVDATDERNVCQNCGHEYVGRYCPMCGQSAHTHRLTLGNIIRDFFEQGLHLSIKRLPFTLKHLLTRPGKMIGEYLDGHRSYYYPPVKMLFILSVVVLILRKILPINIHENNPEGIAFLGFIEEALNHHRAYSIVVIQLIATWGSWLAFRHSPLRPKTTLAENFVIQIYISCAMTVIGIATMLVLFEANTVSIYGVNEWIFVLFYFFTFKQLFGFGWWGTLWRTIVAIGIAIAGYVLLFVIIAVIMAYQSGGATSIVTNVS